MEPIFIELCGVPQGKGRPRFARSGSFAYTPSNTRKFEADLKYQAQEAMAGRPPVEGPLDCLVVALFPIPKRFSKKMKAAALAGQIRPTGRPDWDNIAKMLDAFKEVVWRDDTQVVDGRIRKLYSDRPALQILVREAKT